MEPLGGRTRRRHEEKRGGREGQRGELFFFVMAQGRIALCGAREVRQEQGGYGDEGCCGTGAGMG